MGFKKLISFTTAALMTISAAGFTAAADETETTYSFYDDNFANVICATSGYYGNSSCLSFGADAGTNAGNKMAAIKLGDVQTGDKISVTFKYGSEGISSVSKFTWDLYVVDTDDVSKITTENYNDYCKSSLGTADTKDNLGAKNGSTSGQFEGEIDINSNGTLVGVVEIEDLTGTDSGKHVLMLNNMTVKKTSDAVSADPTEEPTEEATDEPTEQPTEEPSQEPSGTVEYSLESGSFENYLICGDTTENGGYLSLRCDTAEAGTKKFAELKLGSVTAGDKVKATFNYGGEGFYINSTDDRNCNIDFALYVISAEDVEKITNDNYTDYINDESKIASSSVSSMSKNTNPFAFSCVVEKDYVNMSGILIAEAVVETTADMDGKHVLELGSIVIEKTSSETPTEQPSETPSEEPTETPIPEITANETEIFGKDNGDDGVCSIASIFETTLAQGAPYGIYVTSANEEKKAAETVITGGGIKLGVLLYNVPEDIADGVNIKLKLE